MLTTVANLKYNLKGIDLLEELVGEAKDSNNFSSRVYLLVFQNMQVVI